MSFKKVIKIISSQIANYSLMIKKEVHTPQERKILFSLQTFQLNKLNRREEEKN